MHYTVLIRNIHSDEECECRIEKSTSGWTFYRKEERRELDKLLQPFIAEINKVYVSTNPDLPDYSYNLDEYLERLWLSDYFEEGQLVLVIYVS